MVNTLQVQNKTSTIEKQEKAVIKRNINDESFGDSLKIVGCQDSTIIILHPLSTVYVMECKRCSIFLAPCKGR